MNIDDLKKSIKAALPDAPESLHDFYFELVETITPKQESFTRTFDERGEANYTTVYQPTRIDLNHADGKAVFSPRVETGLLFMRGTDGSIAVDDIRNNLGLRTKTMSETIDGVFRRHLEGINGEVDTRFIAHGISRFQFGNTHNFEMARKGLSSKKAIPEPYVHGKGFNANLEAKIDSAVGMPEVNPRSSEWLKATLKIKAILGLDDSLSPTEIESHLNSPDRNLDLAAFFDPRSLASLNGDVSDDKALHQQLTLAQNLREYLVETYHNAAEHQFADAKHMLRSAASQYASTNTYDTEFDSFAMNHYPLSMINFIVTAKGNSPEEAYKTAAHRKLFIEAMASEANIDWFEEIQQPDKSDEMSEFLSKLRTTVKEGKHGKFYIEQVMSHIDKGKIPRTVISKNMGVDYVNKNQFRQALQNHAESFDYALALAKLPDNWFTGTDMFSRPLDVRQTSPHNALRSVDTDDGPKGFSLNDMGYSKIKPYLIRTGQKIGRLDSRLQQASQASDPERAAKVKTDVNKEKKDISRQYAWLAKKDDAVQAIRQFDKQYKIQATLGDYENTINIFLDALANRAAYDIGGEETLKVNEEGRIEIKYEELNNQLYNRLVELEIESRYELDSDHRDYDDPEVFVDKPDVGIFSGLFDDCTSIKSAAENNYRLHNSMSSISKTLGEYSTNNVEWNGLIKEPVELNGYRFVPITDRKRLLQEGVVQNHCVYTLLNPCLSGETSVFSVEDDTGNVVATMEVRQDVSMDGTMEHESVQLYGPGNSGVSNAIQTAGDMLIDALDEGLLEPICLEDENNISDFIDNDDVEEIADLQVVPFLTDAFYDAYGVVRDHLPDGMTFDDLIQKNDSVYELFALSESGQSLLALNRLAQIYDLNTQDSVALAKTTPVKSIIDHHNKLYQETMSANYNREQALIVNKHANNQETIEQMADYAEAYEEESFLPLWGWIEDNVDHYPEGMSEDTFRRCLRNVIQADCAEEGLQSFAEELMFESNQNTYNSQRHYNEMISELPENLSPETLINAYSDDAQKLIRKIAITSPEKEHSSDIMSLSA